MLVYFVHFFSRRRCLDFHLSLIACLLFCTLLSQFLFGHFCCHCSSIQLSLTLMTAISILLYHKNWAHYYHYTFSFFFSISFCSLVFGGVVVVLSLVFSTHFKRGLFSDHCPSNHLFFSVATSYFTTWFWLYSNRFGIEPCTSLSCTCHIATSYTL